MLDTNPPGNPKAKGIGATTMGIGTRNGTNIGGVIKIGPPKMTGPIAEYGVVKNVPKKLNICGKATM
jgi:hypothetical protein